MSKKRKSPKESYRYESPLEQEFQPSSEPKYKVKMVYMLDPTEVAALVAASLAPYEDIPKEQLFVDYESYSEDEVLALLDGRPYRRKRKKK